MPTYGYVCDLCDHEFELRQGFDAEPRQPCPRCRGAARRRFHAVGVIYKGSGFYTTDYRKSSDESSSKSSSGAGEGGSPGDSDGGGSKKDKSGDTSEK